MAKGDKPRPPADAPPGPAKLKIQRKRRRLYDLVPVAEPAAPEPAAPEAKPAPKTKRAARKPKGRAAVTTTPARRAARDEAARELVRNRAAWSAGIGLMPWPLVDVVAISAIQLNMIKSLADLYEVEYSEQRAKAFVGTLLGTIVPASFLHSFSRIFRMLPGFGFLAGLLVPGTAGAATYALGRVFMQHFAFGGTLLDFEPETTRAYLEEQYAVAKEDRRD